MTIPQTLQTAVRRHQAGQLKEAETLYRQILAAQPNHADALHLLGVIAHQTGRDDLAVEWIRQAIALNPNDCAAHSNLGESYRTMGRLEEAVKAFRRALEINANLPETCNNLGIALRELGQIDEAVVACRQALELKPDYPKALFNLGVALLKRGDCDEAMTAYQRAIELQPDYQEAHLNLGTVFREQGDLDRAVAAYRRALQINPNYADAEYNLGVALKDQGRLDEAVAAYRTALQIKPDHAHALNNLGVALMDQGLLDEAIAVYRFALQPGREGLEIHSNLIYTLHFHPACDGTLIHEERRRWNRQFSDPLEGFVLPHANDRDAKRLLRIGYVSSDFREHVIGRNLKPLFERHDRREFEILCYSGVVRPDSLTEEIRGHAQQWRSTVGMGDEALAEMIRRDGVDILVDLTQHMAGNRLPMFARKPAPVQVSFAGYPESTGLTAIKYRISDRYLEAGAAGEGSGKAEQVCLIDSFWCYDPCGAEVEVSPLPAMESRRMTFGCLNNFCKVNERALRLWARVLGKVKDSRLMVASPAGSQRERTVEFLRSEGVEAHRVEFVEHRPRRAYLELYHRLDIVLDTFPYNGHTTSMDALWMGAPVVSLLGEMAVSRAGLSLLTNLGLPKLVARSEEEYVCIAASLAGNLPRLAQLRSSLRERMENSVLMDAPRFARQVEKAYRNMWQAWCNGQSPIHEET
jgi:protein O-GlcNAc transferase